MHGVRVGNPKVRARAGCISFVFQRPLCPIPGRGASAATDRIPAVPANLPATQPRQTAFDLRELLGAQLHGIGEARLRGRAEEALHAAQAELRALAARTDRDALVAAWDALRTFLTHAGGPGAPRPLAPGEARLVWAGEGAHALPRAAEPGHPGRDLQPGQPGRGLRPGQPGRGLRPGQPERGLRPGHPGRGLRPGRDSGEPLLVPRDPRADLERALAAHAREAFLPPEALCEEDPAALAARAGTAATTVALGRVALEPLVEVARVRRAAWAKPRLVLAAELCLPLGRVPEALRPALLEEPGLRADWEALGWKGLADQAALASPHLPVDTARLGAGLRARLREALGQQLDDVQGLFFQGENAGALRLVQRRLREQVRLAYLDPPFNTACERRAYKDAFDRATWLSFMDERLQALVPLLCADGTVYAHIDGHEKERLRLLLDRHLHHVGEIVWRIGWCSGFKTRARKFLRNHDTIYHYGRGPKPLFVKRYLPYPEGYKRRDGQPPRGQGYPLEDTWNCSPLDRLDSIQIVSFSREKVGNGLLTQKPEALLLRMLEASSLPGDWVLDPFAGSGTTCAAAHKSGRRWIGIEWAPPALEAALPRLRRVVGGDRYGISAQVGWAGGGAFAHLRLERLEDTLGAFEADPAHGLAWTLEGERLVLRWEGVTDFAACRLAGPGGPGAQVDLPESLSWLLGLGARREQQLGPVRTVSGADPQGQPVVCLWAGPGASPEAVSAAAARACSGPSGRLLVWAQRGALPRPPGWQVEGTPAVLEQLLQPE